MYSQNDEEAYILKYFSGATKGTFLDIGAFHPKTFSNTRALYEQGFKGVFVEPSPSLLPAFEAEYGSDPAVQLLPICVGATNGMTDFFDSGGDAISSTIQEETKRWEKEYNVVFKKITRDIVTVEELIKRCNYKTFDFINVDTEGNVLEILEQIDAAALGVKLMWKWNGKDKKQFEAYFRRFSMKTLMENGENMICGI